MTVTNQNKSVSNPHATTEWKDHEHVTQSAASQAQQLVEQLGSVELAKQAVQAVGEAVRSVASGTVVLSADEDGRRCFAKAMGFSSFEELLTASEAVASNDGMQWFLTSLPDANWAAWNDSQLHLDRHYVSREEAWASVPHETELTGSSLLG